MISERFLSRREQSLEEFYNETTEYYIAQKFSQCRANILAMSKQQMKDYFFLVLALYPNNRDFLDFIMSMI